MYITETGHLLAAQVLKTSARSALTSASLPAPAQSQVCVKTAMSGLGQSLVDTLIVYSLRNLVGTLSGTTANLGSSFNITFLRPLLSVVVECIERQMFGGWVSTYGKFSLYTPPATEYSSRVRAIQHCGCPRRVSVCLPACLPACLSVCAFELQPPSVHIAHIV